MQTVTDIYENLFDLLKSTGFPLMVNRSFLVDRVKLEEGVLYGRSMLPSLSLQEKKLEPVWVDITQASIESIQGLNPVAIPSTAWVEVVYPVRLMYVCHECGDRISVTNEREALSLGWTVITDPLGNEMTFCPNSDCQETKDRYQEIFE